MMVKQCFWTRYLIKTANGECYDFCDVLPLCDADLMCLALASAFETARREGQKGEYVVCGKAFQMAYDVYCHLYTLKHHKRFFLEEETE